MTERIAALDWRAIAAALDLHGCAVVNGLVAPETCDALATGYDDEDAFRSRIVMAQHGFGRGEYKYFAYPLPPVVSELRAALYPALADIANPWNEAMGIGVRYPSTLAEFLDRCHRAGQTKPTPLLSCATARATTTACTRTSTASTCFRSRPPCSSPCPGEISRAASSC